jgi:hypothetical protein
MNNIYTKLYHITPPDALDSIIKDGLRAGEDGYIYFFTDLDLYIKPLDIKGYLPDIIAIRQVLLEEYVLLEIDTAGLTRKLVDDNVPEMTATQQKRVKQKVIAPEYILSTKQRKVDFEQYSLFYNAMFLCMINGITNQTIINKTTRKAILKDITDTASGNYSSLLSRK